MKKYLLTQFKRLMRLLLPVLLVAAILFGCLMVVMDTITALSEESAPTAKFRVGIVGIVDDLYLQLGLKAMESMDSTRFSLELVEMEESEAESAMRSGSIAAFIVFPEGFLDNAMSGDIIPLKFVCTSGAIGIVSMLKDEFTQGVETMLIESQKGIYGSDNALHANGLGEQEIVGDISIEYAEFIFKRGNFYRVSELGVFNGLGMDGYLGVGISIVVFLLVCLTFAPVMIRRDLALTRMLCANRHGITGQVLCDLLVYLSGLFAIVGVLLLYLVFWRKVTVSPIVLLQGLPAVLVLGTMSFMMYELSSDLVSGILLQFFSILALCFVCGCMYPITFFPESVQILSGILPVGLARVQLSNCATGAFSLATTLGLAGYICVFVAISVLVRRYKATQVRG